MKNLLRMSALLVAIASMSYLSACKEDEGGDDSLPNGWTQAQRTTFINECVEGDEDSEGASEEYCECQFEGVSEEWSPTEYDDLGFEDIGTLIEIGIGCL